MFLFSELNRAINLSLEGIFGLENNNTFRTLITVLFTSGCRFERVLLPFSISRSCELNQLRQLDAT